MVARQWVMDVPRQHVGAATPAEPKRIGFWYSHEDPSLPDPRDSIDLAWDLAERARVAAYLKDGKTAASYRGWSTCRICHARNGSRELTDGVYNWPEGYAHYLTAHSVKPPADFIAHVNAASQPAQMTGAVPTWHEQAVAKLAAMEQLVAQGQGDALVSGGGCTEPGGGIVPTARTARETAAMMRQIIGQQAGASPPTSPPPFGRPAGHIGGSYDWWWWNFGRPAGMKYDPPTMERQQVGRDGPDTPPDLAALRAYLNAQWAGLGIHFGSGYGWPIDGKSHTGEPARWHLIAFADDTQSARAMLPASIGGYEVEVSAPIELQQAGSLTTWLAGETFASTAKAAAPIAIPVAAGLLVKVVLGVSWPMALVTACALIPVVWFATHQQDFGQQA